MARAAHRTDAKAHSQRHVSRRRPPPSLQARGGRFSPLFLTQTWQCPTSYEAMWPIWLPQDDTSPRRMASLLRRRRPAYDALASSTLGVPNPSLPDLWLGTPQVRVRRPPRADTFARSHSCADALMKAVPLPSWRDGPFTFPSLFPCHGTPPPHFPAFPWYFRFDTRCKHTRAFTPHAFLLAMTPGLSLSPTHSRHDPSLPL